MIWPEKEWTTAPAPAGLADRLAATGTAEAVARMGTTHATVVIGGGRLLGEWYADGVGPTSTLRSWSMAKSMLHAVVGVLVGEGRLALDAPPGVPGWDDPDDPRSTITLDQLLHMRSGLAWREDYVDAGRSDVIEMLWGAGSADTAGFAAAMPAVHEPGASYAYSSGTSNIVSGIVARTVGGGAAGYRALLDECLFGPIAMRSAAPRFDAAGTWIASSYCFATARDFARLGLLYGRDGRWGERRVVPEGWVAHGTTPQPDVDDEGWGHGAHWWTLPERPGWFFANGFESQYVLVVPDADLVVVRLGASSTEQGPAVQAWLVDLCDWLSSLG